MSANEIWSNYIRYIGAGAVTFGGIVTLVRSFPTIISAFSDSFKDLKESKSNTAAKKNRTEKDIPLLYVLVGSVLLVILMVVIPSIPTNLLSSIMIVVFGFFFVTVSSRIVGLIGSSSNPISGMTIATLMATALIFVAVGWTGEIYQPIVLVVGSIVCIASANAGATSQDLKTGYIVGATPVLQQIGLLIGVLASVVVIGFTIIMLNNILTIGSDQLPAPQATLMATVIKGLLSQNLPWGLVIVGMGIAAVMELSGVRSLPFAVGAYLPLSVTSPIFAGGLVKLIVDKIRKSGEDESEIGPGALLSSGLIAGGALTGILIAGLKGWIWEVNAAGKEISVADKLNTGIGESMGVSGDIVSLVLFASLAVILITYALGKEKKI
jgi:putative OPT family oligopeptide transporter